MGYDTQSVTIGCTVSRHNSAQDDIDDELWADLLRRIEELAADPRYQPISVIVY